MFDFIPNDEISFATPKIYRFDDDGYVEQLLTDGTYTRLFHPETFENDLTLGIYGKSELAYLKENDLKSYVKLIYENRLEEYLISAGNEQKSIANNIVNGLIGSDFAYTMAEAQIYATEIMNS